jgi:hypothetical protein
LAIHPPPVVPVRAIKVRAINVRDIKVRDIKVRDIKPKVPDLRRARVVADYYAAKS